MDELKFVFRIFIFTVAFVFLCQIHIGPVTVEDRMHAWIQGSSVTGFMQGVADAGIIVAKRSWVASKSWVQHQLGHDEPKRHQRRPQGVPDRSPEAQRSLEHMDEDSI